MNLSLTRLAYHISLLLQVSKIAKNQGDHALSSDLVERALFTFGRASLSAFNNRITTGKARLDFARPENRELWLAGHHYIQSLSMKGTYRTALEWAKLLLSLDPEADPYALRTMIHYLALRAHEYDWLREAAPVSTKLAGKGKLDHDIIAGGHNLASVAFAALQSRDGGAESRQVLRVSMQSHPWLFCELFKEMSLDAPRSIWGMEPRTDAEKLFTQLYIQDTKDLWNMTAATSLLMEVAHALPPVDLSTCARTTNDEMNRAVVRHVYLGGDATLMALVPSAILHQQNNSDSDPIPPVENVFSYGLQRHLIEDQDDVALENNFYNPLQAMRNLMAGHGGLGDEGSGSEDELDDDETEGTGATGSLVSRIWHLLRGQVDNDTESETPGDVSEGVAGETRQPGQAYAEDAEEEPHVNERGE